MTTTLVMTNEKPTTATTLRPYKVRMTCGHGEWRLMREETAGVAWTEDTIINAPSMPCRRCRQTA